MQRVLEELEAGEQHKVALLEAIDRLLVSHRSFVVQRLATGHALFEPVPALLGG